uniref:Uncharacterized protein n=1 Tax=Timema douglasi TaxID=61478 RepID=A0A7R8VYU9_TIMDO|nr:unnamed protein product [Timema douglasi]
MIFEELVEMWSVSSSTPPGSADVPGVRSGVNLFLVSLSQAALEQVQSNLAPYLSITGYTATGPEQLCSFMLLRYFGAVVQDRQIGCRREGITGDSCVHASHLRCWNKLTLNWPWIEMPPVVRETLLMCLKLMPIRHFYQTNSLTNISFPLFILPRVFTFDYPSLGVGNIFFNITTNVLTWK